MLTSDAGRYRSLLRVTFSTPHLQQPGFVGWGAGGRKKKSGVPGPGRSSKHPRGLHFTPLGSLPWH